MRRLFAIPMLLSAALVFGSSLTATAQGAQEGEPEKKQEEKKDEKKKDKPEKKKKAEVAADDIGAMRLAGEAARAAQDGDLAKAIEKIDAALEKSPYNVRILPMAAQMHTQFGVVGATDDREAASKHLRKAGEYMRRLNKAKKQKLDPREKDLFAVCIYNEACCLALEGKKKKAYKSLRSSIKAGFRRLEHLQQDDDLKSLRDEEEFKKIVAELKKTIEQEKRST